MADLTRESAIEVLPGLSIPESELLFTASRSSGPGGQHVNKVSTRVTLHFDVGGSPSLTEAQRRRIASRLPTRINKSGVLKMHAQRHRSRAANRAVLVERFVALLQGALAQRTPRKKTRPSRAARDRRLQDKQHRGWLKKDRSRRFRPDD